MKPLILDYKVQRSKEGKVFYKYNHQLSLNVLEKDEDLFVPFIDADKISTELETKTKADRERDDEDLVEFLTKTERDREKDEEDYEAYVFLELATKTFTSRERDDEDFADIQY